MVGGMARRAWARSTARVCASSSGMAISSSRVPSCSPIDTMDVVMRPVGPSLRMRRVVKSPVNSLRTVTSYSMTLSVARLRTAEAAGPSSGMESASAKTTVRCWKVSSQ